MGSVDVQDYFRLGLDTTDRPIAGTGVINIVRKAPDTISSQHNQVIFRFDNEGLLTKDSGITLRPKLSATATAGNVSLNIVNGILGSISRATLRIDGQTLTDVVEPALLENQRLYSRNSVSKLLEMHQALIGNQFATQIDTEAIDDVNNRQDVNVDAGLETLRKEQALEISDDQKLARVRRAKLGTGSNKTYFIPLSSLGMNFLRYQSLPMYLLQDRQVELVLEFESDARKWAFDVNDGIAAGDALIDLQSCELTQVRIQLDEDIVMEQREMMAQEGGVDFELMESYTVKHVITTGADGVQKTYSPIRINAQNREVQKLMVAFTPTTAEFTALYGGLGKNPLAQQVSLSLGEVEYNWRINGAFLYDKDITSSAVQYYLNAEYNGSFGLKVSRKAWALDALSQHQDKLNSADIGDSAYAGRFYYVGQSLRNGNSGVQGAGTGIRVPIEFLLASTAQEDPSAGDFTPKQANAEVVLNIYVSNTKLLKIMPTTVMMSF
jgi:hypothetical protein